MSKERQLYRLSVWCTVRVESDLRTSRKYFIDVLMVALFWENQLKKEMTFISEIKNKIRRTGIRNIYPVFQPPASQFLNRVHYYLWRFLHFKWKKKNSTLPVHHLYICIVGPTVHDSRWHNIDPSHDKTWLRCVRRITTQISLRICTVYSNKSFFVRCFGRSACYNGSFVKKLRYVNSSCVQMQFTAAWRGPLLRPWTYYRTDWSGVDQ